MNPAPDWWYVLSGLSYALSIVVSLLIVVVLVYLLSAIRELKGQIHTIGSRVEAVAEQAKHLTETAKEIAGKVGGHAVGASSSVAKVAAATERTVTGSVLVTVAVGLLTKWLVSKRSRVDNGS